MSMLILFGVELPAAELDPFLAIALNLALRQRRAWPVASSSTRARPLVATEVASAMTSATGACAEEEEAGEDVCAERFKKGGNRRSDVDGAVARMSSRSSEEGSEEIGRKKV